MRIHCKYDALVPIRELKPYAKNRNKHPKEQIERLAKILDYQGQRAPIIVGTIPDAVSGEPTDPRICKGHGTADAIELLGENNAAVVYQHFENEDQRYAFVQSDNAIANWAELDLAGINADIGDLGPDFDIDLLGIEGFTVDFAEKVDAGTGDWEGMPEFNQEDKFGVRRIVVHFKTHRDVELFAEAVCQKFTDKTRFIWFPEQERGTLIDKRYESES